MLEHGVPHKDIVFRDLRRSLKVSGSMMRLESQALNLVDPMKLTYDEMIASNNGDYSRATFYHSNDSFSG